MIRFCGGETAAVEKKEPFEDASKKILLIVRKTESVHDLLKRWYLAKESEKTRRSSNGPSSEMGKKLLTDPTIYILDYKAYIPTIYKVQNKTFPFNFPMLQPWWM